MLATLEETKLFLGITDSSRDSLLEMLIGIATDYIEGETGRTFASTEYTNEEYDGTGMNQISLRNYPVISFSKLEVNNTANNTDSWSEISDTDYWVDNQSGIITKTSAFLEFDTRSDSDESLSDTIFHRGKNRYRATFTAGYSVIPNDIKFACMSMTGNLLFSSNGKGIKSETLGDHSVSYDSLKVKESGGGLVDDIISRYRNIPLAL